MQTQYNINLNIPLNFSQVVDIVKQLSPSERTKLKEVLEGEQDIVIPEEHKSIVRQRMKTSESDPSRLLNWDEVKHKIKL
ncbi:MAG TPA: addiction module protein [Daejeonella sp.]|nr:addiction module protein [Daejeonella sp.]